jgi:hypothetical protein
MGGEIALDTILFHSAIYDDREEELELTEPDFRSPIPERYRWRNWTKTAKASPARDW